MAVDVGKVMEMGNAEDDMRKDQRGNVLDYVSPEGRSKEQSRWGTWAAYLAAAWLVVAFGAVSGFLLMGLPRQWVGALFLLFMLVLGLEAVVLALVGLLKRRESPAIAIAALGLGLMETVAVTLIVVVKR